MTVAKQPAKHKKLLYDALIVFLVAVILFCGYKLVSYYAENHKSEIINETVVEDVVFYDDSVSETDSGESTEDGNTATKKKSYYHARVPSTVDFTALKAKNSQVVGWLFHENGVINYPVMQSEDDAYYLNHLIDHTENNNGSLFMEWLNRPDFTDDNTLIYGHSMKNGSMFATLLRYKSQSYYDAYPCFYLYTPEKNYRVELIAGYETTSDDSIYTTSANGSVKWFAEVAASRSAFKNDCIVSNNDRLVTFSTCAYSSDNARFVVVGKLVSLTSDKPEEQAEGSSEVSSSSEDTSSSQTASSSVPALASSSDS